MSEHMSVFIVMIKFMTILNFSLLATVPYA